MRIGIFGGSFDPIHRGHIHFAKSALRELQLDRLYFVPAKISPLKEPSVAAGFHRSKMARLAIQTEPRFRLETCELKREGPSYSYLTARRFKRRFHRAELFFLLGDDALKTFKKWKKYKQILKNASLVVVERKKMLPYSSTEVRAKLREGKSILNACPKAVCSYIKKNKLYV